MPRREPLTMVGRFVIDGSAAIVRLARISVGLFLLAPPVRSQVPVDSATRMLKQADSILVRVAISLTMPSLPPPFVEPVRRATALYGSAAVAFRVSGDKQNEARALAGLVSLQSNNPALKDSVGALFDRAVQLYRDADVPRALAELLIDRGEFRARSSIDGAAADVDSALAIFRTTGADSIAASALSMHLDRWRAGALMQALAYQTFLLHAARGCSAVAERLSDELSRARCLRHVGDAFRQHALSRPDSALIFHRRALDLYTKAGDSRGPDSLAINSIRAQVSSLLNDIGLDYRSLGQVDSASAFFHRSLDAPLGFGSRAPSQMAQIFQRAPAANLAYMFAEYGVVDSAVYFARKLLSLGGAGRDSTMQLSALARALLRAGEPDSALRYSRAALSGLQRGQGLTPFGRGLEQRRSVTTIGLSFLRLGLADSALTYFRMLMAPIPGIPSNGPGASASLYLSATHRLLGNADSALAYASTGLGAARIIRDRRAEAQELSQLALAHQAAGNALVARAYMDSTAALRRELGLPFLDLSGAPTIEDDSDRPSADARTLTPLVAFLNPIYPSADSSDVLVPVAASDRGGGIQDIRLYDNGSPVGMSSRGIAVERSERCPPGATCFRVTLPPGRHALEAAATARDGSEGNRAPRLLTVPGKRRPSRLFVLAIGINEYQNSNYHLDFARADARAVIDSLRAGSAAAFQDTAVVDLLIDRDATRDAIEARLLRAARQARPEDVFIVYYAGHGKQATIGATTSFFLVPTDVAQMSDPDVLGSKGISSARLLELLRNVPARQKMLILDACQSGSVASAYTWQQPVREAFGSIATGSGTWILAASRPQQNAAESPALGHGVFTSALLRALGADGSGQRREINVASLFSEVVARVDALALRAGTPSQTPIAVGGGEFFTLAVR